jgi:Fe-S cluster assembly iron-binding protein IscA
MINITKNAAEKFNEIRQKAKNPENAMLRIYFGGFG